MARNRGGIGGGTLLLLGGAAFLFLTPQGRTLTAGFTQPRTAVPRPPGTPGATPEDRLIGAGVSLIPSATSAFADWIRGLFTSTPPSATTPAPTSAGSFPSIPPIPDLPSTLPEWWTSVEPWDSPVEPSWDPWAGIDPSTWWPVDATWPEITLDMPEEPVWPADWEWGGFLGPRRNPPSRG